VPFRSCLRLLDVSAIHMRLTPKEQLFIKHFLIDLNQHQAARLAGYKAWAKMSVQCMQKPEIRDAIRKAMKKRYKKFEAVADKVIQDLADIAHLDRSQVFQVRNGVLHVTDTDLLPERVRRCISKISQTQHGIRIEFDDRIKALELLGRHLALFTDNLNVNGNLNTGAIDDMTEEEIDAELKRLEDQTPKAGKEEGESKKQSA